MTDPEELDGVAAEAAEAVVAQMMRDGGSTWPSELARAAITAYLAESGLAQEVERLRAVEEEASGLLRWIRTQQSYGGFKDVDSIGWRGWVDSLAAALTPSVEGGTE